MATSTAAANATGEVSRLLSVYATTRQEQWRLTWFGTTANPGAFGTEISVSDFVPLSAAS